MLTFKYRHNGGGWMSVMIRFLADISGAITSLVLSWSSLVSHIWMLSVTSSGQAGIIWNQMRKLKKKHWQDDCVYDTNLCNDYAQIVVCITVKLSYKKIIGKTYIMGNFCISVLKAKKERNLKWILLMWELYKRVSLYYVNYTTCIVFIFI